MLNRSQIYTLLILRNREDTIFSQLPIELIREISEFGQNPNSEFATTLKHVARGELEEAKAMLDQNPRFVLQSGTVMTRAGLTVCQKTPLEVALGEGDPEMAAMIMSYFSQFEGGEREKEKQLERYRPLIEHMQNQKPYDLTKLIELIKNSSAKDVTAALHKDMEHDSNLRDALIQFRKDVNLSIVKKPQMHYNYQTIIHALEIFDREWDNLYRASGNNYDKCDLVWRQVIGYLQRGLPAVDRFAFARGLYDLVENKMKMSLERNVEYKYGNGSFPDTSSGEDLAGLGFDYGIWAGGGCGRRGNRVATGGVGVSLVTKLMSNKNFRLQNLCEPPQNRNRVHV